MLLKSSMTQKLPSLLAPQCAILHRRTGAGGDALKKVLAEKIPKERERIKNFRKEFAHVKLGEATIDHVYNGMRDLPSLICETSLLDPNEGIRFRGFTIPDLQKKLPHACGREEPLPEGLFWLLLTGEIPTQEQVDALSCEFVERSKMPEHVVTMLNNFPKTLHPMSQFSCGILGLQHDSKFYKAFMAGAKKDTYWEYALEDSLDCIAKLPTIAAKIYVHSYKDDKVGHMNIDPNLDWTANFARMMGYTNEDFDDMLRLYLTIHSDHDCGNVSAHTTHLVGSALSDPYLALSAGINGLAGPLHGLANQLVLNWLHNLQKQVGTDVPSEQQLTEYVRNTLKSGQVVPGYGHAVLRKTDPRYTCQAQFAAKYMPDDPTFKVVSMLYKIVPPILTELGKVKNPWPNVDAHSGVLLMHYGMVEMNYYTVLFGVSRALGVLSQLIWNRAMMRPIERPKSFTTEVLMEFAKKANQPKSAAKK